MPALDPFSAASKPMLPFDNLPSRPLPFAATLHPIDLNSPNVTSSKILPKPRIHKESNPKHFPSPQYSHSRHVSSTSLNEVLGKPVVIGSDDWMQSEVAKCVDSASGNLTIANLGLKSLSTKIADLRDLVTLPSPYSPFTSTSTLRAPPSPHSPVPEHSRLSSASGHLSASARSFTRTSSAPASSAYFNTFHSLPGAINRAPSDLRADPAPPGSPTLTETSEDGADDRPANPRGLLASPSLPVPRNAISGASQTRLRSFGRSKTGAVHPSPGAGPGRLSAKDICIYAGLNALSSLPSVLFELTNLTVLSLRGNRLTALPAAIGELHNLKELNISNNQINELPSTILNLTLHQFSAHPNPFLPAPRDLSTVPICPTETRPTSDEISATATALMADLPVDRTLSPSIPHDWLAVPRLSTLCLNLLMSPCEPSHLPPLLDAYEWDTFEAGRIHPLLDAAVLHQLIPNIPEVDLRRVLQAMKSAGSSHALSMSDNRRGSTSFLLGAPQPGKVDPFPRSHRPVTPDDASINPWFYPCPSPRHLEFGTSFPEAVKRSRNLFLHPAEERIEWRDVFGITALPIRWLGCSPGCLAFLEEEEGDDWGLDEG